MMIAPKSLRLVRRRPWTGIAALATAALLTLSHSLPAQRVRIGSSAPSGLTGGIDYGSAFFAADDGALGSELWLTDGFGPPLILADIYPGQTSSYPDDFVREAPGTTSAWFVARAPGIGRELHHFPALAGSLAVADILPGSASSHPANLTYVETATGPRLFFTANNGIDGRELFVADPSGGITSLDINPGPAGSFPNEFCVLRPPSPTFGAERLLFGATTATHGTELWISDGTALGTSMVADIEPGPASSSPRGMVMMRSPSSPPVAWFAATTTTTGRELWASDGGTATLHTDIAPGPTHSAPDQLTAGDATIAFTAFDPVHGRQLRALTPGFAVSDPFTALPPGESGSIAELTTMPSGDAFWFRARTLATGAELWKTGSTSAPPTSSLVADLAPGPDSSFPSNIVVSASGFFALFRADDGVAGQEMWRVNTLDVVTPVEDVRAGGNSSYTSAPEPIGTTHFVFAGKSTSPGDSRPGIELWNTSGMGAFRVADLDSQPPTPEIHMDLDSDVGRIDVFEGTPGTSVPGWVLISTGQSTPIVLPFVVGAIVPNPGAGFIAAIPFTTSVQDSAATIQFSTPSCLGGIPFLFQAVLATSAAILEATGTFGCTNGVQTTPMGREVKADICIDDESGEYKLVCRRTDIQNGPAYVALVQVMREPEERKILSIFPIEAEQTVRRDGRLQFKLQNTTLDLPGDGFEIHVFDSIPDESDLDSTSLVVQSYC